jgi:hypothetical protein
VSADDGVVPDERPVAWRVTGGGDPSREQLAAITIALTPVRVPTVEDAPGHATRGAWGVGNWQRAAIVEGLGGRRPASLQDLVQGRFGLGRLGDPTRRRGPDGRA